MDSYERGSHLGWDVDFLVELAGQMERGKVSALLRVQGGVSIHFPAPRLANATSIQYVFFFSLWKDR